MSGNLLVDDEANIRFTLAQTLREHGDDVEEASDGDGALKRLGERDFDLVVTDILMPNRKGLETIMGIRMNWPKTKIVAMSGGGRIENQDFLNAAAKFGARSILRKPFSKAEFRDAIADVIADKSAAPV